MANRFLSTARFLFVVIAFAGSAVVTQQLSAQSATPPPLDIFGLWLTRDPAGVSMIQVLEESADSSTAGIGRLREPFAGVFRCSIESSWSNRGDRYYSVTTVSGLIEGARLSFAHYLLRLSQNGQTLEIVRSSATPFRRSSAADPEDADSVVYRRLCL